MKWVYVEDIAGSRDEDVEIRGWVYNKRSSGKVRFLLVRDGTGILQTTVFSADENHPLFKTFDALTQESSLEITGVLHAEERAPGGYLAVDGEPFVCIHCGRCVPFCPHDCLQHAEAAGEADAAEHVEGGGA